MSQPTVPRGGLPSTRYEAMLARDDARRFADDRDGGRVKDLLVMLAALLDERLERAAKAPSGRCEYCGHNPDSFGYDEGDD